MNEHRAEALAMVAALVYASAPGSGPDRAKRAVETAVEILEASEAKMKELAKPEGHG